MGFPEVCYEYLGKAYVEYIHAIPVLTDKGWKAKITTKVTSVAKEQNSYTLDISLEGMESKKEHITLKPGEEKEIEVELQATSAQTWEMENPQLYRVSAVLFDENGLWTI